MWNNLNQKVSMEQEAIRRGEGAQPQEMPRQKALARLFLVVLTVLLLLWIFSILRV